MVKVWWFRTDPAMFSLQGMPQSPNLLPSHRCFPYPTAEYEPQNEPAPLREYQSLMCGKGWEVVGLQ